MTQENMQEIRGTLLMKYIETAREPAQAMGDIQIFYTKGYYDWYIQPYRDLGGRTIDQIPDSEKIEVPEPIRLEKGDLLTVFNTISKADVIFDRTLNMNPHFEFRNSSYNDERSLTMKQWRSMFIWELPAYAEKMEDTVHKTPAINVLGSLYCMYEQGMEGVAMTVQEYGKNGYDGLHSLNNGDRLVVYTNVQDGNVFFEQTLDFNENGPFRSPSNPNYVFNRIPSNIDRAMIYPAFGHNLPAILRRAPKP